LLADVDDAADVDFSMEPDFVAPVEPDSFVPEPESEDPAELSDPLDPDAAFDSDLSGAGALAVDLPRLSVR
jgi:hypothetical protein